MEEVSSSSLNFDWILEINNWKSIIFKMSTALKMSRSVTLIAVILFGIGISGCTKCTSCTDCPNGVTLESSELCENDFNSKADFDQAVDLAISFGCTCVDN